MQKIKDNFAHAIAKNRLSHLYLFYGQTGNQKLNLVKEIAYMIFNAKKPQSNLKTLIENENYPNLIIVTKTDASIKKGQIMDLQDEFSKTSLIDGLRIFIIDGIETMSIQAANSLLKFLEEPKNNETIGFLITDNISMIIPTIISRSQLIYISGQCDNDLNKLLKSNGFSAMDAKFITTLTTSIEEAVIIQSTQEYQQTVDLFNEIINTLANNQNITALIYEKQAQLFVDKKWIILLLNMLINVYLDVIHLHMNQNITMSFMKDKLMTLVNLTPPKKCELIVQQLQETVKTIHDYVNVGLTFISLAIKLNQIRES